MKATEIGRGIHFVCTDRPRTNNAPPSWTALRPNKREKNPKAGMTRSHAQLASTAASLSTGYRADAGTLPATMAKAKRRKLRARRNKANHGRKPNAGRG